MGTTSLVNYAPISPSLVHLAHHFRINIKILFYLFAHWLSLVCKIKPDFSSPIISDSYCLIPVNPGIVTFHCLLLITIRNLSQPELLGILWTCSVFPSYFCLRNFLFLAYLPLKIFSSNIPSIVLIPRSYATFMKLFPMILTSWSLCFLHSDFCIIVILCDLFWVAFLRTKSSMYVYIFRRYKLEWLRLLYYFSCV